MTFFPISGIFLFLVAAARVSSTGWKESARTRHPQNVPNVGEKAFRPTIKYRASCGVFVSALSQVEEVALSF